jgi:hypothetical protein
LVYFLGSHQPQSFQHFVQKSVMILCPVDELY